MAGLLRVLLVDRLIDRAVSLKRMLFFDSELRHPGDRGDNVVGRIGVGGLTVIEMGSEFTRIVPRCLVPNDDPEPTFMRFQTWWHTARPIKWSRYSYSREFVVYETANTDAVHVSDTLDADYARLSGPLPGVTFTAADGTELDTRGVVAAAIRQIAWEVDRSLTVALASRKLVGPDA